MQNEIPITYIKKGNCVVLSTSDHATLFAGNLLSNIAVTFVAPSLDFVAMARFSLDEVEETLGNALNSLKQNISQTKISNQKSPIVAVKMYGGDGSKDSELCIKKVQEMLCEFTQSNKIGLTIDSKEVESSIHKNGCSLSIGMPHKQQPLQQQKLLSEQGSQ